MIARRAVLRWAWRMFRRDWRQQTLVLALLTITVAAAVAGTAMAVNGLTRDHGFGDASAFARIDSRDDNADRIVAAINDHFGDVEVVGHHPVRVPGFAERLDLRSQEPGGRFGAPLLRLRAGRYPTGAGEIALTADVADDLGVGIGDTVDLDGRTWSVVGEVENPAALDDDFALVAPTERASSAVLIALFDLHGVGPRTMDGDDAAPVFQIEGIGDDSAAIATLVLVVATLAMALTALVATAGFVVVAQRRQRQLGLLGALGASERHLRLVMVANGVIVGLVAAVAGGLVGIAGWFATAPAVESAANHRIDRFDLPWLLLSACLVLAVAASTLAAWWPARAMARLPIIAALARRPARPLPVHRSLALALALLGLGVAAIAGANPLGRVHPPVLIAGIVAVVIGVVLAAPAAIRAVASAAPRLPLAPRLALRDLARYQARAAAALGAIVLGLGVSVAVVVIAKANEAEAGEGNLSDRQLLLERDWDVTGDTVDAAATEVAAAVDADQMLALERARNPAVRVLPPLLVEVATPMPNGLRGRDEPYVATLEVLAALGIDPASIDPSTELLTTLEGDDLLLFDSSARPGEDEPLARTQHVELPAHGAAPQSLITEAAMAAHGWVSQPVGWLLEADHALTDEEVASAREIASAAGLSVQVRDDQDSLAAVRTSATAVGVLLALAIVAMAIGLLRGEAAQDVRTLTATGAPPRTRRAVTASTAATLAAVGAALSLACAYAAIAAAYHADLARLAPVPTADLLTIALVLPLAATAAGWLLAGREPPSVTRQAFE